MSAPARYATAPNPHAVHELSTVEAMARFLDTPLMPWQSQVARVVTERRADGKGWRYPVVVLTVPRQSGKTTIMRAIMAQRTLRYPGVQVFYTAQSGKDARERWDDLVDLVDIKCPALVNVRRAAGRECMEWKNGRGQVRLFAPTKKALHGYTPESVMLDEAFAFDEDLGAALLGAIVPSQATLSERQMWIVSTAGDEESTWFKRWINRGRESLEDPAASIAYFEWSAEDGLDLSDPATYAAFHPAIGYTQTAEEMAQALELLGASEFERAYGNRWAAVENYVVSTETLNACLNDNQTPPADMSQVTLAYDIAADRSAAAIWACWTDEDGTHLRPYLAKSGIWWVADEIKKARNELGVQRIGADDGGATRSTTKSLELDGINVTRISARDFANATGEFIHALETGRVDHNGDAGLYEGLAGSTLRRLGEAQAWSRQDTTGAVWNVIAATAALHLHTYTAAQPAPRIIG